MKKVLRFRISTSLVILLCVATAIAAPAQTFTTLAAFDGYNGYEPRSSPIQGQDGNFYGTTEFGNGSTGFLYRITPGGKLTNIYTFNYEGTRPIGRLLLGTDGNLYGTTFSGGTGSCPPPPYSCGTVFKSTLYGTLTTLHNFDYTDGGFPYAGLIQADNAFYGTTEIGGTNDSGTIFKITSNGTFTTLYNFCSRTNCADGANPYGGLVQGNDGNFYGTTEQGGTNGYGTVFKITSSDALTTLYNFCTQTNCTDGANPYSGLTQASDGNFYGTTGAGGTVNLGTAFVMTPEGALTTLHSFCLSDCLDGYAPSSLTLGTNGNLYGTTEANGAYGGGTIYEMTPTGVLNVLYAFDRATEAYESTDAPVQGTDGTFYGTTAFGGVGYGDNGSVFSLSVELGPFVETAPTVGKRGSSVIVLGNHLTGTTGVTFNGTPASFTVISPTEIKTTVPTGATSGKVQVTTPTRTLTSNVAFQVK
jgi:uncharacterized repeat protein (TIGR03803 family)